MTRRWGRWFEWVLFAAALTMIAPRPAQAAVRSHLLVIGNNRALTNAGNPTSARPPLRFADDDAAAFYELLVETAQTGHLLTVMDAETQAIYPALTAIARPPTIGAVRSAVAALERSVEEARQRGDNNAVYIFFSGHGSIVEGQGPALALLDGGISHQLLYDEILGKLSADYVHVFVDACHAEAVVRPRDTRAAIVPIQAAEADTFLAKSTLARFPHVGAVVAATGDAQAHEWDQLRHGVFTHELLSALRGAADVNRDRRIEYSEIYAFLAAANRGVEDTRARMSVVARPPEVDRHIALVDLTRFPSSKSARLQDLPARAGLIEVEDGVGRRLASLRGEIDFVADLVIPAGTTYVRAGDKEARFVARPGEAVSFDNLNFRDPRARSRGALEDAVSRGLFASEFGRGYYRGFIDQAPDFVSVVFASTADVRAQATPRASSDSYASSTSSLQLVAGVGASSTVANSFNTSQALRVGLRPALWRGPTVSVDLSRAAEADTAEWRAAAAGGWSWSAPLGPARGWIGASIGGGVITQTAPGVGTRRSGLLQAGPSVGVAANVSGRFGFWGEALFPAAVYRQDGAMAVSWAPAVFVGVSLGL